MPMIIKFAGVTIIVAVVFIVLALTSAPANRWPGLPDPGPLCHASALDPTASNCGRSYPLGPYPETGR